MKKFTIWQDTFFMDMETLENWKNDILECCEENGEDAPDDYEIDERIEETNGYYLEDERANMSEIDLPDSILCIGDLGLWNGRVSGYREIDDLCDCFYSTLRGISYCEWYVDAYGNLRGNECHHDGTNHYLYRMWKPEMTDDQRDNLLDKIYRGDATMTDISRYTVRLGDYIGDLYGWKFCGKRPKVYA